MNKAFLIILILGGIIILLTLLKIYLINSLSVQNVDYNSLTQQKEALRQENMTLYDILLKDSALTTINQKAQQEGFIPAQPVYLK